MIADQPVELGEFLLQGFAQPGDAARKAMVADAECALTFGGNHLDDLAPACDQIGKTSCHLIRQLPKLRLAASAKCAITAASIGSVLARLPRAIAKARTCAGLTITTGRQALARPAATTVSKPPVASIATNTGDKVLSQATRSSIPAAVCDP